MPRPNDGAPSAQNIIPGDGIGPLVMNAVEQVIEVIHAPVYFENKVIVKLKYADLVSILPTNVSVVVWPIQIWRFSVNISTMNTLEGPTCLLYAEDALRTMSLPEAYTEIVLNLPYKLFGKCTKSPLNITLVSAAEFVQSHSKNWFREKDSSLI
ncbi:uncharacterized protein LOC133741452 isoform X4 [Rosa rugosa]|uniref:uncharacterized protein LOC133741452 isoform X4 n=1 Tax=Rosa rugosa TaxID=74645 RepID=UPI002B4108AD|nr:uncharacterized protein LOC133741452 isoform X4 [Rosa rugosa]